MNDIESGQTYIPASQAQTPSMKTNDRRYSAYPPHPPYPSPPQHRMANPKPAGLLSFAATTWLLSMYNLNTRGVQTSNLIFGMGLFCGGSLQLVAGLLAFPYGDLFAATAFTLYGAFWLSYSMIYIPGTGILAAYTDIQELNNALGLFLIVWMMITFILLLTVIKRHLLLSILLTSLTLAYMTLAIGSWTSNTRFNKAGGGFGVAVAMIAFYLGLSDMLKADEHAILQLPQGERTQW